MTPGPPSCTVGTFEATVGVAREVCRRYDAPRVLDAGCGRGELLTALAPVLSEGWGIDVSADAIRAARRRAAGRRRLHFEVAPVERLPASVPTAFDVILFVGSLEHMADPRVALEAARSRIHSGGRVVVVAIAPGAPHAVLSRWMLSRSRNPVVAHLGARGLLPVAERAGLGVEEVRPLFRGSRGSRTGRSLGLLLSAYDRWAGPTNAVVLGPT